MKQFLFFPFVLVVALSFVSSPIWCIGYFGGGDSVAVELEVGWNLISFPFNSSINKQEVIVQVGRVVFSWDEAISNLIINDTVFGWANNSYYFSNSFKPCSGYWVYAYQDCELVYYY